MPQCYNIVFTIYFLQLWEQFRTNLPKRASDQNFFTHLKIILLKKIFQLKPSFPNFLLINLQSLQFMIASQQIESLLKETKINSTSDIIQFILENISRIVNFQPLEELSMRITEIQRPKGLDRIMIEEVKTLVEAMLDQREHQFRRQYDRKFSQMLDNYQAKINNQSTQSTRKALSEMDVMNMLNTIQLNSPSQSKINPIRKQSIDEQRRYCPQILLKQLTQVRLQLQKKAQKKQILELKHSCSKQLSNKMSMKQTEAIVSKFQVEIFNKINSNIQQLNKIQYNFKKVFNDELLLLKKDFQETFKIKEMKNTITKFQKKLKKVNQDHHEVNSQFYIHFEEFKKDIKTQQDQLYDQVGQICHLVQNMSASKQNQGCWISKGQSKASCIVWDQEIIKSNKQVFQFDIKKSPIMLIQPGYYSIQCYMFKCTKAPLLMLNSQIMQKFQIKNNYNEYLATFTCNQLVFIQQNRSLLSIKIDHDCTFSQAILIVKKI